MTLPEIKDRLQIAQPLVSNFTNTVSQLWGV